jgi:hypothetical protein
MKKTRRSNSQQDDGRIQLLMSIEIPRNSV